MCVRFQLSQNMRTISIFTKHTCILVNMRFSLNVWCLRAMDLGGPMIEGPWGRRPMGNDWDMSVRFGMGQG